MRGNGYERELKYKLARLPQHKKMPELTKHRMLQTLKLEEGKLKKERNWGLLRSKMKWATLTLVAGLILVIGGYSLKDKIQTPETGVTQGTQKADNPLAKLSAGDVQSLAATDGASGEKINIDDTSRIKGIIETLNGAHPKPIKAAEDEKGFLYRFNFDLKDGTLDVTFLGDKIKVNDTYYSLDTDVSGDIKSIVQASPKQETTDNQNTKKNTPTTTDITLSKVADFKMFSNGMGWLQSDEGLAFTNDNGQSWKTITPNIGSTSQQMMMPKLLVKGQNAWFALYSGNEAFIYRSKDGGTHWTKTIIKTDQPMQGVISIHFSDDTHGSLLLSGDEATGNEMVAIYQTNDGGASWSYLTATQPMQPNGGAPYSGMKTSLVFKNNKIGWITGVDHGDQPYLYQTTDGGHQWAQQALNVPSGYTAEGGSSMTYAPIFFNQNDGILPVRFGGDLHPYVFYSTHNGGATWEPSRDSIHTAQGVVDMNDWDFVNQNVGYAASGKQLFVTKDGGNHWDTITLDRELVKIHFQTEKSGYALSGNQLLQTSDGGKTWNLVTTFK